MVPVATRVRCRAWASRPPVTSRRSLQNGSGVRQGARFGKTRRGVLCTRGHGHRAQRARHPDDRDEEGASARAAVGQGHRHGESSSGRRAVRGTIVPDRATQSAQKPHACATWRGPARRIIAARGGRAKPAEDQAGRRHVERRRASRFHRRRQRDGCGWARATGRARRLPHGRRARRTVRCPDGRHRRHGVAAGVARWGDRADRGRPTLARRGAGSRGCADRGSDQRRDRWKLG